LEVSFVYIGSDIVFLAFVFSLFGVNFSSVFLLRLLTSRFVSRDHNIPMKMATPWKEFLDQTDKPDKFEEKILKINEFVAHQLQRERLIVLVTVC